MAIPEAVNLVCRFVQPLFALIVMGMCAWLIPDFHRNPGAPSQLKFLLFTSVWTLFPALPLLVLKSSLLPPYTWTKISFLFLEVATFVFWFAGFVSLAVWYEGMPYCIGKACPYILASIGFGVLEWYDSSFSSLTQRAEMLIWDVCRILFSVTAALHALSVWHARHNRSGFNVPKSTTI
ncbi:MAG: hypothetical protein Q9215_006412 [Flavoplaca cf. flavocitrina]